MESSTSVSSTGPPLLQMELDPMLKILCFLPVGCLLNGETCLYSNWFYWLVPRIAYLMSRVWQMI